MDKLKVTLVEVSEVQTSEQNGNPYFIARFKQGVFGRTIARALWGKEDEEGHIIWERGSPDELRAMVGKDFSGEVSIEPAEIEPQAFVVPQTGEEVTYTSRVFVRFSDESQEQAIRKSGSKPRKEEPISLLTKLNSNGVSKNA